MGYEGGILTQNTILYLTSFVPRYRQKQVMQIKINVGKADVLDSNLLVAGKCLQIQILLGFIFPPHMKNIHQRGICMCVRICWWWGMRRSSSWLSHNCTNTWNVPVFLSNSQKYIYYYFETFFSISACIITLKN